MSERKPLSCPNCGSEQTQRASVIHATGTTVSVSRARGGGLAFGEEITPVLGGGNSRSVNQTELAKALSPPAEPVEDYTHVLLFFVLFVAGFIGGGILLAAIFFPSPATHADGGDALFIGMVAWLALSAGLAFAATRFVLKRSGYWQRIERAKKDYRDACELWDSTYFCHRCGDTFVW